MISFFDLELVPKTPTSRSCRLEVSTYAQARSGDGDNRRTCHRTVYVLFLARKCGVPMGIHKSFYFAVQIECRLYSVEMEGKMTDNNNKDHTRSI